MIIPQSGQEKKSQTPHVSGAEPWITRNGFSHGGMALIWIVAAFFLFQVFANVLGITLILARASVDFQTLNAAKLTALVGENIDLLFWANTAGQILFLGLCTWWFSRLHVSKQGRPDFLRLRTYQNTPKMLGMAFVLIITIQPAIWFLGWLNAFLPVPESMETMQMQQMEMIKSYLTGDGVVLIALLNIAFIPAICEEVLFRGYVLRSFQKSWGIGLAILISGIIFGMFHLQPSNFLPLASIGILLAFLTWVSQSLYPAMLAHFVNNGASVVIAKYYPETAFSELSSETMPPVVLVVISVVVSGYLIYWLLNNGINESDNLKRGADAKRS